MTDHTTAAQAANLDFVGTELRGIIDVCGDSPTAIVSVERMRLWLSKLRAPVAGEAISDLEALLWAEKHGLQWALKYPDEIRAVIADAQRFTAPQASEAVREQCCGNIVEPAEAVVEAHDSMFAQCCSNPVRNAWGDEVSMLALNQAYELARAALSAQPGAQKEGGSDA